MLSVSIQWHGTTLDRYEIDANRRLRWSTEDYVKAAKQNWVVDSARHTRQYYDRIFQPCGVSHQLSFRLFGDEDAIGLVS